MPTFKRLSSGLILLAFLFPLPLWAAGIVPGSYPADAAVSPARTAGSTIWQLLQLLFLFGLIIFLVIATTRFLGKRMGNFNSGKAVRVLDWTYLGPNRAVYAVEIGEQVLILGVTEHQINLLTELTDPQQRAALQVPAAPVTTNPRHNHFLRWLAGRLPSNLIPNREKEFSSFLEGQLHRLHRLSQTGEPDIDGSDPVALTADRRDSHGQDR